MRSLAAALRRGGVRWLSPGHLPTPRWPDLWRGRPAFLERAANGGAKEAQAEGEASIAAAAVVVS